MKSDQKAPKEAPESTQSDQSRSVDHIDAGTAEGRTETPTAHWARQLVETLGPDAGFKAIAQALDAWPGFGAGDIIRDIWQDIRANLTSPPPQQPQEDSAMNADDPWHFVDKFPEQCTTEVSRKGHAEPCDEPAYAIAFDAEGYWPVCIKHTRGQALVPLAEIVNRQRKADR